MLTITPLGLFLHKPMLNLDSFLARKKKKKKEKAVTQP
jgi:hypothetical protein